MGIRDGRHSDKESEQHSIDTELQPAGNLLSWLILFGFSSNSPDRCRHINVDWAITTSSDDDSLKTDNYTKSLYFTICSQLPYFIRQTRLNVETVIFCVMSSILYLVDGVNRFLRNVGNHVWTERSLNSEDNNINICCLENFQLQI
jgi:hypothetical protein